MSQDRLNARIRAIKLWGLAFMGLTVVAWVISLFLGSPWRQAVSGLLLGELGGAYVLISLIYQGHHNDNTAGPALFASGMIGMFSRIIAMVVIMVIALHWRSFFNPYFALIGFLLGNVFVLVGFYGLAKDQNTDS